MNEHKKWQSHRLYHETFSTSGTAFPQWPGTPKRCKCGCSEVWYDRLSPPNWWSIFNLANFASIVWKLVGVFRALHSVLWHLPSVIRIWLQIVRADYEREVLIRLKPGHNTAVAIFTARVLFYGIITPLTVVGWATIKVLAGPGVFIIGALFLVALALILAVLSVVLIVSIIAISMSGLVFIIGGVGSILYLDNPAIGIAVIVVGVCVQYELNRREGQRKAEELGYLILMLRPELEATHD